MTDLDRQVATLRGWTWDNARCHWADTQGRIMGWYTYSPATNLLQAFQLWEEARPEGWWLETGQLSDGSWFVFRDSAKCTRDMKCTGLPDLPRAITQAWVEAREGRPSTI